MGYIPDEVAEEILQRIDIVQLISEYVLLKKQGKNYFGLCPFHQEDTPSFSVAPDKQIFYCFGCNVGGNAYKFLMLKEGLSYPEAVRLLGRRVGVHVPESSGSHDSQKYKKEQRLYKILEAAAKFYHRYLLYHKGEPARNYLDKRGITEKQVETFQLGYAPAGWNNLINFLTSKGCNLRELEKLGLVIKNRQGTGYYDRFRNRIILPICDAAGRIVGFGGRALDNSNPKYLNTPETSLFNKRHLLYGLHLAKNSIRDSGYVLVMEGYMDVIAAHQFGISNAVASLGTALTREQVKLLKRYTNEIVISYDADAAGVNAALRGLDIIQQMGCRVKVLQVPQGKDPDEYLRINGAESFKKLVKSAYSLIDYKLYISTQKGIPTTVPEKIAVLQQVLPNLAAIKEPVEQEESIKKVASFLNVSWETVTGELKRHLTQSKKSSVKKGNKWHNGDNFVKGSYNINLTNARYRAEYILLGLILTDFELFSIVKRQITAEHFENIELKNIYSLLLDGGEAAVHEPAKLTQKMDEKSQQVFCRLLNEKIPAENKENMLQDCISIIIKRAGKKQQEDLLRQLKEAEQSGDQDRVKELLQELQQLYHKINTGWP